MITFYHHDICGVTIAYNLGAGVLRAIGDSMTALYILILAAVFNVILDLLLSLNFKWEYKGRLLQR